MNNTPSYIEDHSSQIPALMMLIKLGYEYLSPEEVKELRDSHSDVLLKPVLEEQLRKINNIDFHGKTYPFSNHNISAAVDKVNDLPLVSGLIKTNEKLYHLLTLGSSLRKRLKVTAKASVCTTLTGKTRKIMYFMWPKSTAYSAPAVIKSTARILSCLLMVSLWSLSNASVLI
jgi:hypothetical protein